MDTPLLIYTVYDHPKDYPDSYVVRITRMYAGKTTVDEDLFLINSNLIYIQIYLQQMGLVKFVRAENDDPVILEVYM